MAPEQSPITTQRTSKMDLKHTWVSTIVYVFDRPEIVDFGARPDPEVDDLWSVKKHISKN